MNRPEQAGRGPHNVESAFLLRQVDSLLVSAPAVAQLLDLDTAVLPDDAALLGSVLANLATATCAREALSAIASSAFRSEPRVIEMVRADLEAAALRNCEAGGVATVLLFYRGFHALLAYRLAHLLWRDSRIHEALAIKAVLDRVLGTDIHPAARIGAGVWLDHGIGIVIGETAIIEDDVSMWHGVTLGSTLRDSGDARHPRVRRGAMIGAGATILGSIEIGVGAVVAAGAVVLADVLPHATVAGVPARERTRTERSFRGLNTMKELP